MTPLENDLKSRLSSRLLTCPVQGNSSSFQLVDESGSGEPYAGLTYTLIDSEGQSFSGHLDIDGIGKITNHFAGPTTLLLDKKYQGHEKTYIELQRRNSYPLEITELQVRAEQTRYINKNATRTQKNPAIACADEFIQVEVRHLVKHVSHLPPEIYRHYPHSSNRAKIMGSHGKFGVALMPHKHTVLEVRPLRALSPMLSTAPEFCTLNLYQLALMATLSYCPFGQQPDDHPVETSTVCFPIQPSVGHWFGDALAKFDELWRVDAGQKTAFYPLYEDVPYSKRLEIVPFDPNLYQANKLDLNEDQEHPSNIHFLNDTGKKKATDTQAFITHNDKLVLIAVRGTAQLMADGLRDADASQVPFGETDSKVHKGFYESAQTAYEFVVIYLEKFYAGQKLMVCGHSLGGAVALLLCEMLRRRPGFNYNIQLYTYGAPRAGDASFVKGAKDLVHHRMVNHNDPVPSVPGTWMDTKTGVFTTGAVVTFSNVPLGLSVFVAGITNWTGEPYEHHGTLKHFMPVDFGGGKKSAILWEPGCDTINQHAACSLALQQIDGLPDRPSLLSQIFQAGNHSMTGGYIPACWAALKRSQEALDKKDSLVTQTERDWVQKALERITAQLRAEIRSLNGRPDAYRRSRERTIDDIGHELDNISTTSARLRSIRYRSVLESDVYGALSEHPEALAKSLERWLLHPENRRGEQLAMAPNDDEERELMRAIYGRAIEVPYTLDIDSLS